MKRKIKSWSYIVGSILFVFIKWLIVAEWFDGEGAEIKWEDWNSNEVA